MPLLPGQEEEHVLSQEVPSQSKPCTAVTTVSHSSQYVAACTSVTDRASVPPCEPPSAPSFDPPTSMHAASSVVQKSLDADQTGPPSLFLANDRFAASHKLQAYIERGTISMKRSGSEPSEPSAKRACNPSVRNPTPHPPSLRKPAVKRLASSELPRAKPKPPGRPAGGTSLARISMHELSTLDKFKHLRVSVAPPSPPCRATNAVGRNHPYSRQAAAHQRESTAQLLRAYEATGSGEPRNAARGDAPPHSRGTVLHVPRPSEST